MSDQQKLTLYIIVYMTGIVFVGYAEVYPELMKNSLSFGDYFYLILALFGVSFFWTMSVGGAFYLLFTDIFDDDWEKNQEWMLSGWVLCFIGYGLFLIDKYKGVSLDAKNWFYITFAYGLVVAFGSRVVGAVLSSILGKKENE